jgi:hypothetical protein
MLKRFGLSENKGLRGIAEIVHDIDLKDDKFHRLEAVGLNAIIDGLSKVLRDDRKLLQQTGVVFDGLHVEERQTLGGLLKMPFMNYNRV